MRKLKSSLKLSRCNSLSSDLSSSDSLNSLNSLNSSKFVRFAPQLTTVKNFYINDKPISISNETSPILSDILSSNSYLQEDNKNYTHTNTLLYDIDDGLDDDILHLSQDNDDVYIDSMHASIHSSNFVPNNSSHMLNLTQLYQSDDNEDKIHGTVQCNNIAFQKNIQCKFTFNDWHNIHYVNAAYSHSPSQHTDIFKFTLDLDNWKFFWQYHKLIHNNNNTVTLQFVVMFDTPGHPTFYDNNNNNNYTVTLQLLKGTAIEPVVETRAPPQPRTFSLATDYYNESPLKHMFHNDTHWLHAGNNNRLTFFNDTATTDQYNTPSLSSSFSDLSSEDISWDNTVYNNVMSNTQNSSNDTLLLDEQSDTDTITLQTGDDNTKQIDNGYEYGYTYIDTFTNESLS